MSRVTGTTLELEVPPDKESLSVLRRWLCAWLRANGIGEVDRKDVVLAVWEAGANAIEHGRHPPLSYHVEATIDEAKVVLTVVNAGSWRRDSRKSSGGLGLHMIRALMSDVRVKAEAESTVVTMSRRLDHPPAARPTTGPDVVSGSLPTEGQV